MHSSKNKTVPEIIEFYAGAEWRIVNDGVMGGVSQSTFVVQEGGGLFQGNLSSENGGGFASVRAEVQVPLGLDVIALAVRALGDGKRYQLRIRTDDQGDGPAYRHEFPTTKGQWVEMIFPLADFELSFRGRPLPNASPIDPRGIRQIGLLIAGKQWGPFQIKVEWIRAITE